MKHYTCIAKPGYILLLLLLLLSFLTSALEVSGQFNVPAALI